MKLRIAGLTLLVACDKQITETLFNLAPFLVDESIQQKQEEIVISQIKTACSISEETSEPIFTGRVEGRTIQVWLLPNACCVKLTFQQSKQTFLLRTDRHWQHVETDWTPHLKDSAIALNDFIMLTFIYSAAFHQTVLFHASSVYIGNKGCAFIGPSGVGKSTHSQLWLDFISGAKLLNDDQPILRVLPDGNVYLYGSPWSGKTPCFHNKGVQLKALFFMKQAKVNKLTRLDGIEAYHRLLQATSLMTFETESFSAITETQAGIISTIPAFQLENLPNKEAAALSFHTFSALK